MLDEEKDKLIEQIENPEVKKLVQSSEDLIRAEPKRNPGKILHSIRLKEIDIDKFFENNQLTWIDLHFVNYTSDMTEVVLIYSQLQEHIAQK